MEIVLTIISVVTLAIGVFLNQRGTSDLANFEVQAPSVLSQEDEIKEESTPSPTPSLKPTPIATPVPQNLIPKELIVTTNSWIYPNSKILINSASNIELSSTDETTQITAWYKKLIETEGFKSKSYSQTNTNGNILNVLSVSKDSLSKSIQISKSNNSSETLITIK